MKKVIGDDRVLIRDSKAKFGFRSTRLDSYKRRKNTEDPLMDLYVSLMEALQ